MADITVICQLIQIEFSKYFFGPFTWAALSNGLTKFFYRFSSSLEFVKTKNIAFCKYFFPEILPKNTLVEQPQRPNGSLGKC